MNYLGVHQWKLIVASVVLLVFAPLAFVQGETAGSTAEITVQGSKALSVALLEKNGVNEIVFAARQIAGDGHWYANFSYWSNNPKRKMYHNGGRLCRLNVKTGKVTCLINDPKGGVREMKVYGILPKDFDIAKDTTNPYELDRKYWKSLWYHPKSPATGGK